MAKIVYLEKSASRPHPEHEKMESICALANECIIKSAFSNLAGTCDILKEEPLDREFFALEFVRVVNNSFSIHVYKRERSFIVFFINVHFVTYQCYIAKTLNVIVDTLTRDFFIHTDTTP